MKQNWIGKKRFKVSITLFIIFLLIFATNMVDNNRFEIVKNSLNTVYEDRLIAKDYLYKMARQLQIKKSAIYIENYNEIIKINQLSTDSIQNLINQFSSTKLTIGESRTFNSLQKHLNELKEIELEIVNKSTISNSLKSKLEDQYSKITTDLDALSEIQIKEGQRQIIRSTRAIKISNTISKMEIAALIVIGLMIQTLLFFKLPSKEIS